MRATPINEIDWKALSREVGWALVMFLPGALTLFLGFRSGGFYPGATALAAMEMALAVGLRFALARRPLQGVSKPLAVAAVAMGCFAAWTLLSSGWSDSFARALPEYARALLYGLTLLFFGMLPFDVRRIRWMVYGVAIAIVAICAAALVARLLPEVIFDPSLIDEPRLAYPLTYWNALGIAGCVGLVLCTHIACSTRDSAVARVLAAAATPLLALALYYTLSRGGIWAAAGALVLYAVLGRPRALLSGAIAIAPAVAVALVVASPSGPVVDNYPAGTVETGRHVAEVLVACMAGAALLRAALLPLDGWLVGLRLPERARRPALVAASVVALGLALAAGSVANAPDVISTKYQEFTDRTKTSPESRGEERLLSARAQGRFDLWDVALDSYREDRLQGTGAGTYVLRWNRERPTGSQVHNAHSLYLEVLGELGLVGLILLLTVLGLILGAFASRARGPDRPLFAALLAAGLAWAVHAGVDWDWQMPAVTLWLFALGGATLARPLRRRRRRPNAEVKSLVVRGVGLVACIVVAILPARVAVSQARIDASLDALFAGDCRQARVDARDALAAVDRRPAPYAVIAYCEMSEGRYRRALPLLRQAIERDPGSWELRYALAVARAGAGLDPHRAARAAARLNPNDRLAASTPARLRGSGPAVWRAAAAEAPLLPPAPIDP